MTIEQALIEATEIVHTIIGTITPESQVTIIALAVRLMKHSS